MLEKAYMLLSQKLEKDILMTFHVLKSPQRDKPQWMSGSALKTSIREMPGSIPGRVC